VFDLTNEDKFLVLATDGLWDELNRKKSADIAQQIEAKHGEVTGEKLVGSLMNAGLDLAAQKSGITRSYMSQIPPSRQRRSLVDDITIVVVDLANQF
jgi:serine/threonine protein phosphatase PrpC